MNEWKKSNEKPENGDYVLIFSMFFGVRVGWYRDGGVQTVWSEQNDIINWDDVSKWMSIPEVTVF